MTNDTGSLSYPAQSGARLAERHLAFYEGFDVVPGWQRAFFTFLFGKRSDVVNDAIVTYEDILRFFAENPERAGLWDERNTRIRLAVLHAEQGNWTAAEQQLTVLGDMPEEEVIGETLRFAYGQPPDDVDMPAIHAGLRMLPGGWSKDRVRFRVYRRAGFTDQGWAHEQLQTQGNYLRQQTLSVAGVLISIVCFGLGSAILLLRRRRLGRHWQAAALESPWSMGEGIWVLFLSALLGCGVFVLMVFLANLLGLKILAQWSTLISSLPMLWLIHQRLLQPRGLGFASAFGLQLSRKTVLPLLAVTILVLTIERSGALLISWSSWALGYEPHWSDGLAERWVWSSWENTVVNGVNAVVWAPLFEEIGFRGLLYVTLRSRLRPLHAAVISSGVFSLLHLYSISGFLSVFWSGLVWAYAFERFRSLMPAVMTHAIGNLFALSLILVFYR
jgi:membrane protease YdiL (CAAX protease family)